MILVDTNIIIDFVNNSDLRRNLRKSGISVPFQDVMIACVAMENNCEIFTNDNHFKPIRSVTPELRLYES